MNISAAARDGVAAAVREALAAADRATMERVCAAVSYSLGC